MNREKIFIIDGSSYFFRAYYAIQRLSTSKGFPTNAIYGFINMLIKVLEVEKPKKLVIAFDTPKPTFRKQLYKEYKSNRLAPPEDLVVQIPHILRAVDCFSIRRFEVEGFEADDVIGTLAKQAEKEGYCVEIITGDKDLMQLVNPHITLYDTMKDRRFDSDGVVERFQVKPTQIVDLLALMGDSSDNIPGVSGIGEKTAAELLNEFGSLDGIYKDIENIKQVKRRETLLKEKEIAFLSRDLARVHCEVPLKFSWDDLNYKGPNLASLEKFFQEFEFQNLLKRFDLKTSEKEFPQGKYKSIQTEKELKLVLDALKECPALSLDTETTSLSIQRAKLVGVSLSGVAGEAYYIPVGHHAIGAPEEVLAGQIDADTVRKLLKPILEDPQIKKVGQNLKYDMQILRNVGIEVQGIYSDTLLASYLLDPDQPHNLDSLAFRYLGHQNITYEDVTGIGKNQISFAEVTIEKATQYSSEDADVTLRLHQKLWPELESKNLMDLYQRVEVPLISVLADMEFCGVTVDKASLLKMSEGLDEELGKAETQIYELAGGAFNINSPKQLSHILFEKLGLPIIRRTKTGISTDESVLMELSGAHEICACIVKYRELMKLKSTYVEGLLNQIHPATKRIHTSYNQTVTATGRLSSSNPNLQNIPSSNDGPYDIRSVFVAPEKWELLSADYSQVELRLLAHLSQDKELMRAFHNDEDVHEYTGRLIFGCPTVSAEQRKIAKTINFGVMYGQTPYGLSQMLKISPKEAKEFIETYFARYAQVAKFMQELMEQARSKGYTSTLLGRRRYLPEIQSKNRIRREMAERAAINAPLQGTAADMIKIAMVNLHRQLQQEGLKSRMVLQVHDELVLEVPLTERELVGKMVREKMEGALALSVPLRVDMGWGKNWKECG